MDKQELAGQLQYIVEEYLGGRGLELVDFSCRVEGAGLAVRIIVDRPAGGVTIGECAAFNRDLGAIIDEKNLIEQRYILEVSSPGLDRPLKSAKDFLRCVNRRARFFLNAAVNGTLELEGRITKVDDASVQIESAGGAVSIPLAAINRAKQVIE